MRQEPPVHDLLVEVRGGQGRGNLSPGAPSAAEKFTARADEIADSILLVSRRMQTELKNKYEAESLEGQREAEGATGWDIDTLEINFELALQAETGVVIAKASAGATFSVSLTLRRREHTRPV
jgi:hypothetical protein